MSDRKFNFEVEACFFEKAGADGPERKVAGIISTDDEDLQGEKLVQTGLDYSHFLERGFLNLDHSKDPYHILGYPDEVKLFKKGETLPDGSVARSNATWMVGTLLKNHAPADQMWELAQSLQKTNGKRRLGFSVEGSILDRSGPGGKVIKRAKIQHTALTAKPVNPATSLHAFVKSLSEEERQEFAEDEGEPVTVKALDTSSGSALRVESLEGADTRAEHKKDEKKAGLTKSEAVAWIQKRFPDASRNTAERLVDLAISLRDRELI